LQILNAEILGELVVHFRLFRNGDFLHLDVERRLLAGKRLLRIVLRERRRHGALLARLGALEAVLEARDEATLPEHDVDALARAALERLAADLADEVDGQPVAILGNPALGDLVARAALDQLIDGLRSEEHT